MSLPPLPPAFEHLASRPFSFYPPILNVEHNEWRFRRATWSEIQVVNARDGTELWVPRRFLGEISSVEEPVVIVGLNRELEYKGGAVWPHERRVIRMPVAVNEAPRAEPAMSPEPAPVVGIRLESKAESQISRLILGALAVGILACFVVVSLFRYTQSHPRFVFTSRDQTFLELTPHDDYYAVVRKLGPPKEARWRPDTGEIQFQALYYPERSYVVILMGADQKDARYIGTLDKDWKGVLHEVSLPRGTGSTGSMLRGLKPF
jgi:hypothetical protein